MPETKFRVICNRDGETVVADRKLTMQFLFSTFHWSASAHRSCRYVEYSLVEKDDKYCGAVCPGYDANGKEDRLLGCLPTTVMLPGCLCRSICTLESSSKYVRETSQIPSTNSIPSETSPPKALCCPTQERSLALQPDPNSISAQPIPPSKNSVTTVQSHGRQPSLRKFGVVFMPVV